MELSNSERITSLSQNCFLSLTDLNDTIKTFWEIENVDDINSPHSDELKYCNEHFVTTHRRNEQGRYIVTMPIKDTNLLGDSKDLAIHRLNQLWRRLSKNDEMKNLYKQFMQEYLDLNHMELVQDDELLNKPVYYLPHHGILRPSNITTKLRVVFNGSAPTTSGVSLNDILLKGEVKEDIFEIMTRFRTYKYAFTADIRQMYRQILVDPKQCDLLRIVWKDDENAVPAVYRLKTVTYGTSSAPFLAIRTIQQLASDEADNYPMASKVMSRDVYMDDIASGAATLEAAMDLQNQLEKMLQTCGMSLHKWNSNSKELKGSIPSETRSFTVKNESAIKTLGVKWMPSEDQFTFEVCIPQKSFPFTKREVLSVIARLYDPLGLLGPIITRAKIFLQKLWILKLTWEEEIPQPIASEWFEFISSLSAIEDLKIDRFILSNSFQRVYLIGYADASESAYGAVVYVMCIDPDGQRLSKLIASKSRVAPIRVLSIPRLELSACLLLSQLLKKVISSVMMNIDKVILHTDSTIALAWINTPANQLKTFVANRVSKIQSLTETYEWTHIPSFLNPADLISRGSNPKELLSMDLWWHGPPNHIPASDDQYHPSDELSSNELYKTEFKIPSNINLTLNISNFEQDLLDRTNNYLKLIRILSFIFRFVCNLKVKQRRTGPLTRDELKTGKIRLIALVQKVAFQKEIATLLKGDSITRGQVSSLNPFLDKDGLLRVGGRLANSNISFDKKHPILLPKHHKLTFFIMNYFHLKNLHVGASTLLFLVRQEFWPLGGRNTARKVIHQCLVCFKNKPNNVEQIMGNLPSTRVTPNPPFNNVGIDYCGPFLIKYKGQRKGVYHKCYVAIFICFQTKAIHIEIVTDLTSEAMIATLRRFFSRRGKSSSIFSDNATNFRGASSEIQRLQHLVKHPQEDLANFLSSEGISWHFIPPNSPNFGGLWEAAVKSFKHHLKRVVGNARLTLEQFMTVTTQIEAILNSRPLTPLSSDPNDFQALTPGHFLIGRPLNALPESDLTEKPDNCLSQWQRLNKFVQLIWRKWSTDYLSNLQERCKWKFHKNNVDIGSMVLLKNDNLPPLKWSIGRITEVIPGSDNKVRTVIVKTPHGIFKRGISKICLLPNL